MKKINKKVLGIIAITINLLVAFIEILIVCKVIPFNIIMGGMMESYEQAVVAASVSLIIQLFMIACIAIASGLVQVKKFKKFKKFSKIMLIIFTVYFSINIVLNLFGETWVERVIASLMCLVNIICFIGILRYRRES